MAQPAIPAFGNWEATGNTPYTQTFENARAHKKQGVASQPNDPRQHPQPPRKSPLHPSAYTPDSRDQKPKNPPHARRPETDPSQPTESPLHRDSAHKRHANPPQQHHREQGGNGNLQRSPYRTATGSASPMQPTNPSKPKHRSAGMQTPERRASSEGHGPHTPGRGRRNQGTHGHEAPDDDVTVPPFGEWDKPNATSGENYTGIFNRVRNDRLSPNSSARQPPSATHSEERKVQQEKRTGKRLGASTWHSRLWYLDRDGLDVALLLW